MTLSRWRIRQTRSPIYADPPWPWDDVQSPRQDQIVRRHHYALSAIDEIKALPVAPLAADDARCSCGAHGRDCRTRIEVIRRGVHLQDLRFVWVKQNPSGDGLHTGMGYYTRANTEYCLLATKGAPQRFATDVHQVVLAPVGEHSAKPEEVRRRIERLFAGPFLELYGRKPVPGGRFGATRSRATVCRRPRNERP